MLRLGAVVLAAGASTRLGRPKQLVPHQGETLLRRAARLAGGMAEQVVVVLPPDPKAFLPVLEGLAVRTVINAEAAEGMASSLRLGVASLSEVDGALILTVDQWAVTEADLARLLAAFAADPARPAAARYGSTLGIPAVLPSSLFGAVKTLRGDRGAKPLLGEAQAVDLPEAACDLDRPEDLPLRR